jgi:hypothetical protein
VDVTACSARGTRGTVYGTGVRGTHPPTIIRSRWSDSESMNSGFHLNHPPFFRVSRRYLRARHTSQVIRHTSYVIRHTSYVIRQTVYVRMGSRGVLCWRATTPSVPFSYTTMVNSLQPWQAIFPPCSTERTSPPHILVKGAFVVPSEKSSRVHLPTPAPHTKGRQPHVLWKYVSE